MNSRLDLEHTHIHKISEHETQQWKLSKMKHRKKNHHGKKSKHRTSDLWDNFKKFNIFMIGVSKGMRRRER